jgi:hypothetical protein
MTASPVIMDIASPSRRRRKEGNLSALLGHGDFHLRRYDLLAAPLRELFAGIDVIYHLAGRPGVRADPLDFHDRHDGRLSPLTSSSDRLVNPLEVNSFACSLLSGA